MTLALSDYDYPLPEELIATRPLPNRQDSRMMVLHRREERIEHRQFAELPQFIKPGDLLVLNNTRVVNARRFSDDGKIEFLFLEKQGPTRWKCLVRPGRKMRVGAQTMMAEMAVRVEEICPDGERIVSLDRDIDPWEGGMVPLPPYLRRQGDRHDLERYQTVYAEAPGAVAAPTAGLHFTPEMLDALPHTFITLHVGAGTFQPVKVENISEHRMHSETFSISEEAAAAINAAKRTVAVGTTTVRVLAVGTTSVRALESAVDEGGRVRAGRGETGLTITPGYRFRAVDAMLTNFHLPRSSLLVLVSAFAGRELMLDAYRHAVAARYRFYSYGDCMLIV